MRCVVAVQVTFTVHVADGWGPDCTLAQVIGQAETAARQKIAQLDPGPVRNIEITETKTLSVTLTKVTT